MKTIMTVTGPISADELGITLVHEHLFIDLRNQFSELKDPEAMRMSYEKVHMDNLGVLRRNPYAIRDNLVLDDVDIAVKEVSKFKCQGGNAIVDCTSIGIQRQPLNLQQVSLRAELHIIAGCGYYTYDTYPPEMDSWSVEKIADDIVRDITVGIDGTDIKAGVIGEIGTSEIIHANEWKVLMASAIAFKKTGAAIQVHTYPWGKAGLEIADGLLGVGVNPKKIVICHVDVQLDMDYIKALLEKGIFVEFDDFGKEFYIDPSERGFAGGVFAHDIERVKAIKQFVDLGYEHQILITNDICLKSMLTVYGGWGYGHIVCHIKPMLEWEGVPKDVIELLLHENPKELLVI